MDHKGLDVKELSARGGVPSQPLRGLMASEKRPGKHLIFTARIRTRTGKILYAWQFGKKAFAIWVRDAPKA